MIVGPLNNKGMIGVVAAPDAPCWCIAKESWHHANSEYGPWVTCWPTMAEPDADSVNNYGALPYDGQALNIEIQILVKLGRGGYAWQGAGDRLEPFGGAWKEPNVIAYNPFPYRPPLSTDEAQPAGAAFPTKVHMFRCADSSYVMDEPIGTIKPMARQMSYNFSQGWGIMDGVANSLANGGSGLDATSNAGFLRSTPVGYSSALPPTGGSNGHKHETPVGDPNGASAYASTTPNALPVPAGNNSTPFVTTINTQKSTENATWDGPPFVNISAWLERLDNGQQ